VKNFGGRPHTIVSHKENGDKIKLHEKRNCQEKTCGGKGRGAMEEKRRHENITDRRGSQRLRQSLRGKSPVRERP